MKVKAFTTMELSIVMLMSGLISSMAYGGYVLFGKQMHKHNALTEETLNTRQFLIRLKKDTYTSNQINSVGNTLEFVFDNNTITYSFEDERYILRTQSNIVDTIKMETSGFYTRLKNQAPTNNTMIDEFGFTVNYKKNESSLAYTKNYGNKRLIEEELANGH